MTAEGRLNDTWQMSALSHQQTFPSAIGMSALAPKADMCSALAYVCFGPKADIDLLSERCLRRLIRDKSSSMPQRASRNHA
jgi:hypothetical protein